MKKPQHRKPRSAGKKAATLLALLALSALTVGLTARSSFPRLEVCGFRVTEEEYLRAMYRARNEVLSDHAAAGISLTDWSAETALGDPRRLTMDRALELLREYYAVSTLAVERGYLTDASFATWWTAWSRSMRSGRRLWRLAPWSQAFPSLPWTITCPTAP